MEDFLLQRADGIFEFGAVGVFGDELFVHVLKFDIKFFDELFQTTASFDCTVNAAHVFLLLELEVSGVLLFVPL